ncbi:molybdopterin-guanine dinucleotide biosynthesis protein A [Methylophilus rhizosphaerae]|uniref:Molybdenum cofactor guanylyltransferase n=1 Tax=Methylophilus rhizosphaerae TaxID=492660 RepID=A0A1G9CUX4_9PROT|nr:molybdenum cofactor guanylyltransferase MobA [Methylophilus rhizosphaerae]SDK55234.1 molybdopterin-guanine dinucleotide biosynthesis protein A [Methylophilus rhizosphaerae]
MQVTAVILAGGRGTRMGGIDKGLAPYQGTRMIDHVLLRLQAQVNTLLINANRNLDIYRQLGFPVIADFNQQFDGPLAGIQAGLHHLQDSEWLLTVPCDSPLLPLDLVQRLSEAVVSNRASIAIARSASGNHPVFSLLHRDLAKNLDAYLASGERRVSAWQARHPHVFVDFADDTAFTNINTLPGEP